MARKPNTQSAIESQAVPTALQAEQAYQAYAVLQKVAGNNPALLKNDFFCALLDTAFARFRSLFEAL